MQRWKKPAGRPDLRKRLQQAFKTPRARLIKTLTVTCHGNATATQLIAQGKYDWFNTLITDECFPLVPHDPWSRHIGLVELDHDWPWNEGLAALAAHGLEQPTAEDGLCFGIKHPKEQCERFILFPHKPVQASLGPPSVLVLTGDADNRKLDLFYTRRRWDRGFVLAGVRPSTSPPKADGAG